MLAVTKPGKKILFSKSIAKNRNVIEILLLSFIFVNKKVEQVRSILSPPQYINFLSRVL